MPTHDYIIANGTGAAVRADINSALSAIVSLNSSASEPGTMYAYQLWADTGSNPSLLKIRNGANSAWITLRQLDGDFSIVAVEDGLQATPSLTFTNDLNTGVFRSGADALAIVTGGQYAIACTSTQAVGIRTPNPSTALHVAGNARVGADDVTDAHLQIGKGASGNRNSYIDIVGDTTYTDYGLRVIRNNTGANATSELKHRGTGALNITTQEAAPIEFYTTNSPRLTILAGGNVGIGTSSPNFITHISTGDDSSITAPTAGSFGLYIQQNTSGSKGGLCIQDGASNSGPALKVVDNGNSTRFIIDANGSVGIGTTGPLSNFVVSNSGAEGIELVVNQPHGANSVGYLNYNRAGATYQDVSYYANSHIFKIGGDPHVTINSSGRLLLGVIASPANQLQLSTDSAGKPSTNTWTIVSDERIKEEIELADLDLCYQAVKTIPLKRFKWKDEVYTEEQVRDRRKLGWIAQDVEAVFPKAVGTYEFKYNQVFEETIIPAVEEVLDDEGNVTTPAQPERIEKGELISEDVIEDCRDLNSDQLYAAMYGAIQKLMVKVETLETELAALKAS